MLPLGVLLHMSIMKIKNTNQKINEDLKQFAVFVPQKLRKLFKPII